MNTPFVRLPVIQAALGLPTLPARIEFQPAQSPSFPLKPLEKGVLQARSYEAKVGKTGLIAVVPNPIVEATKDFLSAETVSMGINSAATQVVSAVTASAGALTFTALTAERVGFLLWEVFKETWRPSNPDAGWRERIGNIMRGNLRNSLTDIVFHSTMFGALNYAGLSAFPQIPAGLMTAGTFAVSALFAAPLEVLTRASAHRVAMAYLCSSGFDYENYVETRFILEADENPGAIFSELTGAFALTRREEQIYHDVYLDKAPISVSSSSGRTRLRTILNADSSVKHAARLEAVYTLPKKISSDGEYNYFDVRKEKLILKADHSPANLASPANRWLRFSKSKPAAEVRFTRLCAYDPGDLRITLDTVTSPDGGKYYVLELKAYRGHEDKLHLAVDYLKNSHGVRVTTRSKVELAEILGEI